MKQAYGSAVEAIESSQPKEVLKAKLRETRAAASYAPQVAKAAVTFAYEASGSHGMRNPSRLQRCFRDIYVGAAHQVFDERNYNELAKPRACGLPHACTNTCASPVGSSPLCCRRRQAPGRGSAWPNLADPPDIVTIVRF